MQRNTSANYKVSSVLTFCDAFFHLQMFQRLKTADVFENFIFAY